MKLIFWKKKETQSPVVEEAIQAEEEAVEATKTCCQKLIESISTCVSTSWNYTKDTWNHYTTVVCPEFWARQRNRCCPPPAHGVVIDTEGTTTVIAPSAVEPVVVKKKTLFQRIFKKRAV